MSILEWGKHISLHIAPSFYHGRFHWIIFWFQDLLILSVMTKGVTNLHEHGMHSLHTLFKKLVYIALT